jgi:PAS domain S-box-containing protein
MDNSATLPAPGDEQFHLLVDAVRDYAIFMLDPSGVVTTWNAGAQRIKGYAPAEIVGRHFSVFYTPQDRNQGIPDNGLAHALRDGRHASQGTRMRKDGTPFAADVVITPVYKDGVHIGFAKVTRDIGPWHRLQEQLRQRVDELAEADRRKDEFIAMLAHELRNPLSPIVTGLGIVQRVATYPPVGERALQTMQRQLSLMSRLVDDLLQISRITRGKIEIRRHGEWLDEVMTHAVELVLPLVESRHQELVVDYEKGVRLQCDAQRIVQAVSNVVNNASKYTRPGGRISVTAVRDGEHARIRVADNGAGIRSDMLERIFDVFTQDQRPGDTAMQSGLGIGLALARSVVALHGGRISAHSDGPNEGSVFQIVLPLQAVGDHEVPAGTQDTHFRILVVDDNRDAADMIGDLLEVEGYAVERAYSGLDALRKAESQHPHMILLDLLMPDITGYEVIKRVRKNPGGPVVVAVTGHGSEQDRTLVQRAGFDDHVVKPVVAPAILGVVRRFLGSAGRPANDGVSLVA